MIKKTVFSGIQPTANIHLGNYFGAIKNWVDLQNANTYNNIYCIVDLHAITVFQNPAMLQQQTLQLFATLLACGLDNNKSLLFVQSTNPHHAELAWLLNCVARVGWLNRMTQFKEKAGDNKEKSSLGLYAYPVLQAADVLLYNTHIVPVGADQKQHIELARDIAIKFNKDYNANLVLPEPLISSNAPKIKSLLDASKKMSKSDIEGSRISLSDSPEVVAKKIAKAKTDSGVMPTTLQELESREEINNLITIYALCSNQTKQQVVDLYVNQGYANFKKNLAEVIINTITPINAKYMDLLNNKDHLLNLIQTAGQQATAQTLDNIKNIRQQMGFLL